MDTLDVETPVGTGRWLLSGAASAPVLFALGPGHSGHVGAPDLQALAASASPSLRVAIWTPPFVLDGLKAGSPPATLDRAWCAAVPVLRAAHPAHARFAQGGHSAGSRVACRTASQMGAHRVVALSFPLHPPGRAERSRAEELLGAGVPVLVVQGANDTFGTTAELAGVASGHGGIRVHGVPGAGHSLVPTKRSDPQGALFAAAMAAVVAFVGGAGE